MYCNHCGANNPDGATYCNACGKSISATGTLHIEKPATKHNLAELETRSQWCDFLSRFRNHVLQVNDCYDQIERICAKIAVYQAEKTELKNALANDTAFRKSKKVLIGFLIFVSLEIIPSILRFGPGYQDGPADDLKAGAVILAIPLLVFLLLFNRRKHWQREIRLRDENTDLEVKKAIKEKLKLQINFEKFNENKINGVTSSVSTTQALGCSRHSRMSSATERPTTPKRQSPATKPSWRDGEASRTENATRFSSRR